MPSLPRPPVPPSKVFLPLSILLLLLAIPASAFPALPSLTSRSRDCPVKLPEDEPSPDTSVRSAATGNDTSDGRIVNGDIIAPGLAPYLVAIYRNFGSSFKCTGTLVSPSWVVSAAHCEMSTSDLVQLMATKTDEDAELREISQVTIHPSFVVSTGPGRRFDIVAFELAAPAPTTAKFMKVNINTAIPAAGSFVRVAGYGHTKSGGGDSSNAEGRLRQVDVPITKRDTCKDAYPFVDPNAQVCAGYVGKGGCDSCQGDSGGPMIQYTESGEPILVGIVSSGKGCALPDFPGIYVRTAAFGTWMRDTGMVFTPATETKAVFDSGISTGAIVGIVICALVVVVAIVAIAITVRRRKAARGAGDSTPAPGPVAPVATQAAVGGGYAGLPPPDGGAGGMQQQQAAPSYMPAPPVSQPQMTYAPPPPQQQQAGYAGQAHPPPPPPMAQYAAVSQPPQQAGYAGQAHPPPPPPMAQYAAVSQPPQQAGYAGQAPPPPPPMAQYAAVSQPPQPPTAGPYVPTPQPAAYPMGFGSGSMTYPGTRAVEDGTVMPLPEAAADEISAGQAGEGGSPPNMYS